MKTKVVVVVPSWNGAEYLDRCLDSLEEQSLDAKIVVVDNGSADNSVELIKEKFPTVNVLAQSKNLGFAEGVNVGIRYAIKESASYVALFNNDAVAEPSWLEELVKQMDTDENLGIVTSKLTNKDSSHLDSTGEFYSIWGLPFSRGRDESFSDKYDKKTDIFAASGGASLYRVKMIEEVGLFDGNFFAYYEDIDISFRAQLMGWKVKYVSDAIAHHDIGATSKKISGFTTYQTMKNLPMIVRKNVPLKLLPMVLPRFWLAYCSFYFSAVAKGNFWPATKGWMVSVFYLPLNIFQRIRIQGKRSVSVEYINSVLVHDLPPNATRLRTLRARLRKIVGKNG